MQGVSFREDIMETGQLGNPAIARQVQTTSKELRMAVLPLEPQVSTMSANVVSGRSSTTVSTASTQVSATVTPVTTSEATVGSKQSASIATFNSVEVESHVILLLVVLVSLFVISGRFWDGLLFFDLGRYFAVFFVHVFA